MFSLSFQFYRKMSEGNPLFLSAGPLFLSLSISLSLSLASFSVHWLSIKAKAVCYDDGWEFCSALNCVLARRASISSGVEFAAD